MVSISFTTCFTSWCFCGIGFHQMFWVHCTWFVMPMQSTLHATHSSPVHCVNDVLLSGAISIRNYLPIFFQLGAGKALHIAVAECPTREPELIDCKYSEDGGMPQAHDPGRGSTECTPQCGAQPNYSNQQLSAHTSTPKRVKRPW